MTAILTREAKIKNAENFAYSLAAANNNRNLLYMFIGKNAAWPTSTTNGVEIPTAVSDKLTVELVTRSNIIGAKRVAEGNVSHVIPRVDWTTGVTYDEYTNDSTTLFDLHFYVLTTDYNVYKCINSPGTASTSMPTGQSTSVISTVDGYDWKFMYDIGAADAQLFLTNDWMPVPVGNRKSAAQLAVEAAAAYVAGNPLGGHGANAYQELGAWWLMYTVRFDGTEGGTLPVGDDYRQIGLLLDPMLTNTNGDVPVTANAVPGGDFNRLAGRILYYENRVPISRDTSQSEQHSVVIEF